MKITDICELGAWADDFLSIRELTRKTHEFEAKKETDYLQSLTPFFFILLPPEKKRTQVRKKIFRGKIFRLRRRILPLG